MAILRKQCVLTSTLVFSVRNRPDGNRANDKTGLISISARRSDFLVMRLSTVSERLGRVDLDNRLAASVTLSNSSLSPCDRW